MYLSDGYRVGNHFVDLLARHLGSWCVQSKCLWCANVQLSQGKRQATADGNVAVTSTEGLSLAGSDSYENCLARTPLTVAALATLLCFTTLLLRWSSSCASLGT